MVTDPAESRQEDLRRWRSQFDDTTPIIDLVPRQKGTCIGVVEKIRLVPERCLEVTIADGTGRLTALWNGARPLPGLTLGGGLRLQGTMAVDVDGHRRMRNPGWSLVVEPYG